MEFSPIEIFVKGGTHNGEGLHVISLFLPSHSLNIRILTIYLLPGK